MQACSNQRGRFPGPIAPFESTILCSIGVCGIFVSTCVLVSCRMDPAPDFGLHDYEGHGKLKDKVGTGPRCGRCAGIAAASAAVWRLLRCNEWHLKCKPSPQPEVAASKLASLLEACAEMRMVSCVAQIALITGGDSGIGRAAALMFAREGADLAISYLNEDRDAEVRAPEML